MKIFICCSKYNYGHIPPIKEKLEKEGHKVTLPNSFEEPMKEEEMKKMGNKDHINWKSEMLRLQVKKIENNDALLILNFEKNNQPNYIGGATFLEMYKAWELNKKLFLINPIPEGILHDELIAFNPLILNGNLSLIK